MSNDNDIGKGIFNTMFDTLGEADEILNDAEDAMLDDAEKTVKRKLVKRIVEKALATAALLKRSWSRYARRLWGKTAASLARKPYDRRSMPPIGSAVMVNVGGAYHVEAIVSDFLGYVGDDDVLVRFVFEREVDEEEVTFDTVASRILCRVD